MNTTLIILGVVIVILIYVLYSYFTNVSTTLQAQASLNLQVSPISSLNNATGSRYAYGIWIYINTWNSTVAHNIFSRQSNLRLYLDQYAPILKLDINMSTGPAQTMVITDNFPLQKWTNIIVSVDNQYVDAYVDGKLIQSHRFYTAANGAAGPIIPAIPPPAVAPSTIPLPGVPVQASIPLYLGNSDLLLTAGQFQPFDAYVTKFKRWDSGPVDPQTAWNSYMEGNGSNPILGALGNYGASINILKNNIENSKLVLF
jgi:Concanavalin A-like lectin/glucanases superfamily